MAEQLVLFGELAGDVEGEPAPLGSAWPFRRSGRRPGKGQLAVTPGTCERCGEEFARLQLGRGARFCPKCRGRRATGGAGGTPAE